MKIGIRGMGLIGGSFGMAFRAAGDEVVDLKCADGSVVASCELVIVCLPPLLVAPWIRGHAGEFGDGTIVTDAAGVKGVVAAALEGVDEGRNWTYVGGHPMAGRERSGYANALADLFKGASMILTPHPGTPRATCERLRAALSRVGFARFVETTPAEHDAMIAYTSQLAHIVSSAYVRDELSVRHPGFSAGSFQDMTRVATVDPDVWTDLFISNRAAVSAVLGRLIERLGEYRAAIDGERAAELRALLAEGRAAKDRCR